MYSNVSNPFPNMLVTQQQTGKIKNSCKEINGDVFEL
jgi:hypothetical protein